MWPSVTYEELPWHVPPDIRARISALLVELARFDAAQVARNYNLPALLLRSESSASSQIENLTSSVRNVALAEVSDNAPHNALLIAGNIDAMRTALALPDALSVEGILMVHASLMKRAGASFAGTLRDEQVWVGGTAYSPHGALYVAPQASRVPGCFDDIVRFARREDVDPIVKAAIVHAQFETVHPFIDGNGRTGRTLLHKVLRGEGVLSHVTLPVSAGLLHNIDAYLDSIAAYQQGDPVPVIENVIEALELACYLGSVMARAFDGVLARWRERMRERAGSAIYRLPAVLVEQPVVSTSYLADRLGITTRAVGNLVERACEYGILRPIGNRRRGAFYQADDLIDVLEEASDVSGMRRMLSRAPR